MTDSLLRVAGNPLAFSSCPYPTNFPHPGWAEQNPADWWAALGTAVKAAVAAAGVPGTSIAAISLDTTNCTVVALDEGVFAGLGPSNSASHPPSRLTFTNPHPFAGACPLCGVAAAMQPDSRCARPCCGWTCAQPTRQHMCWLRAMWRWRSTAAAGARCLPSG